MTEQRDTQSKQQADGQPDREAEDGDRQLEVDAVVVQDLDARDDLDGILGGCYTTGTADCTHSGAA